MQRRNRLTLLCLTVLSVWQLLDGVRSLGAKGYRRQSAPAPVGAPEPPTQQAGGGLGSILRSPEQRLAAHLGRHYAFYRWVLNELDARAVIAISAEREVGDGELPAMLHRLRNLLYPRIVAPLTKVREFLQEGLLEGDRTFYVLHLGTQGPDLPGGNYQRMVRTPDYEFGRYRGPLGGGH